MAIVVFVEAVVGMTDEEVTVTLTSGDLMGGYDLALWDLSGFAGISANGNACTGVTQTSGNITFHFPAGTFESGGDMVIPSWTEGLRGPNGEWVSGTAMRIAPMP